MDPTIIVAIISAVGGIIVTVIGQIPIRELISRDRSRRIRRQINIPDIMQTKWAAKWCYEDGSEYVEDNITFDKWTKDSHFVGYGEQVTQNKKYYKYPVEGEVSPIGIVVLTYKAEDFPTHSNIGIACLQLSGGAEELNGTWAGLATKILENGEKERKLWSGPVTMSKIKDLNPRGQ
jgi:hypothetical protein